MLGLGKKFRLARNTKRMSIDQVSAKTRISARFLRAIEEERFEQLPVGLVSRGFVRAFANEIGLDPSNAVAEYQDLIDNIGRENHPVQSNSKVKEHFLLPVAIGGLAVLVILFYVLNVDSASETLLPIATPTSNQQNLNGINSGISPTTLTPASTISTEEESKSLTIEISVHDTTWVSITADGRDMLSGNILEANQRLSYTAEDLIELTIGNAAGVSLKINEHEIPSLGRQGQVRSMRITPDNIETFISQS